MACPRTLAAVLAAGLCCAAGAAWVLQRAPAAAAGVTAISAGGLHTCLLTTAGDVKCWGGNREGQLGDGTLEDSRVPVETQGLDIDVVAIAAGESHTCALSIGRAVLCWGSNRLGQLGDGTREQRTEAVEVVGLTAGVVALASGGDQSCALRRDQRVFCWGLNVERPLEVGGLAIDAVALSVGDGHACALNELGGVRCWGVNTTGQLGNGSTTFSAGAVEVSGLFTGVASVGTGGQHSCAVMRDGGVRCWGDNGLGQLGDRTSDTRLTPVPVVDLSSPAIAVTAGRFHTCALLDGGAVSCWGMNLDGQLGAPTTDVCSIERIACSRTPLEVGELSMAAAAVDAGAFHTCAVTAENQARCWGDNRRCKLGDGTIEDREVPVAVISAKVTPTPTEGALPTPVPGCLPTPSPTATPTATRTPTPTPQPVPRGDANCSGIVNSIDAALVLQYEASLLNELPCRRAADVNGNGRVNALDAALILQLEAGLLEA